MADLEQALDLWQRGLSIFPVPAPDAVHDGKKPVMPWKQYQTERPTEAEVREWFSAPQNVAIVTGALSGLVAIDADNPAAVRWIATHLPYTPWQTATAKGFHLFYAHPGIPVSNRARLDTHNGKLAIDVRGDGGYVIGPGSIHASGHVYTMVGDWSVPRTQLPRLWVGWLQRPERPEPTRPGPRPTGQIVDRARKYLAAIPVPVIGSGSDTATLSAACRLVRGFDLSESDAIDLLWQWCGNRDGWTRGWVADKVRAALKYGQEPIGGLR